MGILETTGEVSGQLNKAVEHPFVSFIHIMKPVLITQLLIY